MRGRSYIDKRRSRPQIMLFKTRGWDKLQF